MVCGRCSNCVEKEVKDSPARVVLWDILANRDAFKAQRDACVRALEQVVAAGGPTAELARRGLEDAAHAEEEFLSSLYDRRNLEKPPGN